MHLLEYSITTSALPMIAVQPFHHLAGESNRRLLAADSCRARGRLRLQLRRLTGARAGAAAGGYAMVWRVGCRLPGYRVSELLLAGVYFAGEGCVSVVVVVLWQECGRPPGGRSLREGGVR
jgi:hypothetical protein